MTALDTAEIAVARYPLTQIAGMGEKWYRRPSLPIPEDLDVAVSDALDGKTTSMPDPQFTRDMLPAFKDHLRDLNLDSYWATLAEEWSKTKQDIGGAQRAIEILKYLQDNLPIEADLTYAGVRKTLGPSFGDDSKFLWKCQLAEEPMRFVDLLGCRQLTSHDVECFQQLYPLAYQAVNNSAVQHVVETYSKDKMLPRKVQMQMSVLLGTPVIKLEQLKAYQDYDNKAAVDKQSSSSPAPSVAKQEAI